MTNRDRGLLLGALALMAVVYSPVAGFEFVAWDDPIYVTQRAPLTALDAGEDGALSALLSPRAALDGAFWEYLPLRDATYALDVAAFGLEAGPMHVSQLVWHALAMLALVFLARGLGLSWPAAAFAAALFGVHPLTVEAVAWVSSRKELLYAGLVLLSLGLAARARLLGALAAAVGAMLSKAVGAVAAPLLTWLAFTEEGPRRRRLLALSGVAWVLALAWTAFGTVIAERNGILLEHPDGPGRFVRAIGAPIRFAQYALLPFDAAPVHAPTATTPWADPAVWIGALAAVLGGAWLSRRRRERAGPLTFSAIAFALATGPYSGVVAVTYLRADRFSYLSLAFGALFLAAAAERVVTRLPRAAVIGAGVAILVGCTLGTRAYLPVWQSDATLWPGALDRDPDHPLLAARVFAAWRAGERDDAPEILERQAALTSRVTHRRVEMVVGANVRKVPVEHFVALHLGLIRAEIGDAEGAEAVLLPLLEAQPDLAAGWNALARIAANRGRLDEAERYFRAELATGAAPPAMALNLAGLLTRRGKQNEACALVKEWAGRHPEEPRLASWIDLTCHD